MSSIFADISNGSNQEIPSISAQQEAAPTRPDSPIMLMEHDTLAFFRLYTAMGAEFTLENLKFSKDHDPFASIANPEDVAHEVESRFNDEDLGGNPQDSDVVSVKPLSVRPSSNSATDSSQAHTTPSSSQTAGPTQADTNADKPGDIPIVIRDSLLVAFSDEDLVKFRRYFSIPSSIKMLLLLEGEQNSGLNPSTSDSLHEEGAESVPKAKTGYSTNFMELPYTIPGGFQMIEESSLRKKHDSFRATRPLLLERIRKDYDTIRDPLGIHGVVACHLIKAVNASHALACRADLLDDARAEACENERALQLQVAELKKENERLQVAATLAVKEKKEPTSQTLVEIKKHDLLQARFTSKLPVPHSRYPEEWFALLDLSTPLKTSPKKEEDDAPLAPADALAS
ncbi:hypothetical protein LIER_35563 [Lithospermum erythrorhizon]|uniref:Uncharacterized protein n=1 Tax=Lithospermum erythrorhizon TaxID=34254 RepID=A0AAV3NTP4_LITER